MHRVGLASGATISPMVEASFSAQFDQSLFAESFTPNGVNPKTIVNNISKALASALGSSGRGVGAGRRFGSVYVDHSGSANAFYDLGSAQRAYTLHVGEVGGNSVVVRATIERTGGRAFRIVELNYVGLTGSFHDD